MDRRYRPLVALLSIFTTLFLSHIILARLEWNTAFRMIAALTGVIAMSAPLFIYLDRTHSSAAFSSCIMCGVLMSIGWSWAQTDRALTWMAVYTALIPLILGLSMFILETYSMDSQEVVV